MFEGIVGTITKVLVQVTIGFTAEELRENVTLPQAEVAETVFPAIPSS